MNQPHDDTDRSPSTRHSPGEDVRLGGGTAVPGRSRVTYPNGAVLGLAGGAALNLLTAPRLFDMGYPLPYIFVGAIGWTLVSVATGLALVWYSNWDWQFRERGTLTWRFLVFFSMLAVLVLSVLLAFFKAIGVA